MANSFFCAPTPAFTCFGERAHGDPCVQWPSIYVSSAATDFEDGFLANPVRNNGLIGGCAPRRHLR
jgi:hypothetical protein